MNLLRKYSIALFAAVLLLHFAPFTHAHSQNMEESVVGILHVNPDDSPIVGKEATLVLFITDTKNNFSFETCECTLVVTGPENFESRTFVSRTGEASMTFPRKGVYKALFLGMSKEGSHLFDLNFDIRVEREATAVSTEIPQHFPYLICLFVVVLITVISVYTFKDHLWKNRKKSR